MSNKCTLLIQILREHHVWNMNYSKYKVQVSYFVELPQSHFPNYTTSLTWTLDLSLYFPDLSWIPWQFQIYKNSRKVANLLQSSDLENQSRLNVITDRSTRLSNAGYRAFPVTAFCVWTELPCLVMSCLHCPCEFSGSCLKTRLFSHSLPDFL